MKQTKKQPLGEYVSPITKVISFEIEENLLQTSVSDWQKDAEPLF